MSEIYNIYCDETCHLEHDHIPIMALGCVWSPLDKTREISLRVREIKKQHGMSNDWELKWTKVSQSHIDLYINLVDYFFDDDDLHFRGVLIPDKTVLDHELFSQTHDSWYYKMLFVMLEPIIDPRDRYRVYLDIKDTKSGKNLGLLEDILRNSHRDFSGVIIEKIQHIRSHESQHLQLADLLLGAIGYINRFQTGDLKGEVTNAGKMNLIKRIQKRSYKSLVKTTLLRESKFNLLVWNSGGESR